MKTRVLIIGAIAIMMAVACNKTDELATSSIEGTYSGTMSKTSSLKSLNLAGDVKTDVSVKDSSFLEIHCYGGELDTTLMLNFIEENDSTFLCFSNEQFQGMFGYAYGSSHMTGGMMGNNNSEWMQRMMNENYTNNQHFGGFNMKDHSFDYTFNRVEGDSIMYFHFHGVKQ